jgi:hypothetical protein
MTKRNKQVKHYPKKKEEKKERKLCSCVVNCAIRTYPFQGLGFTNMGMYGITM